MLLILAVRYITKRPWQYILTIIVVALSISLTIAVVLVSASLKKGIIYASMPFDMIVGAKGSPTQLIFNTIFLQDTPIGNVDEHIYSALQKDERVKTLIPFAFGDNYQGYRIVGTNSNIFDLRPSIKEDRIFQLAEGEFFKEDFDAVVGATAAKRMNLKVGDTFKATHGIIESHLDDDDDRQHHDGHEHEYTVSGILRPMRRPYDMGIFTPIETVWKLHGSESKDITAIMVTPKDYAGLMQLYQELGSGNEAQAAFPGKVLANIFSIMGKSEDILALVSYLVVLIGFITVIISLYWSVLNRKRDHAALRALGAGRGTILSLIIMESFIIMITSSVTGIIMGHAIAFFIGSYMKEISYIYSAVGFESRELFIFAIYTTVGVLGSIIPAINAYKQDVAKNLSSI